MHHVPPALDRRLREHGQEHTLAFWDQLSAADRAQLVEQLASVDLSLIQELYARRNQSAALPDPTTIQPLPVTDQADLGPDDVARGAAALSAGEVAVLVVAGGQGSRLGSDQPKGMFPVGPISGKSLFQIHAEKVLALSRRYGRPIAFLVMTSPATHDETLHYFEENRWFGLPRDEVHFFQQGTMPAVDLATGRLLLAGPGQLFLSPNGHGGTLTALAGSGLLGRLRQQGVKHVFYFQVDNPLVQVADPAFLGHHVGERADASSRVIYKEEPGEKLGVLVLIDGHCTIIEYSDLPKDLAAARDADGRLRLRAGSPAIHIFDTDFLARVTGSATNLPFHLARKKVPTIDAQGQPVSPAKENALKFEMFVFDALPLAERFTAVATPRHEEFAPLKNATGPDSPETVKQALSDLAADWLERAGATVPRRSDGAVAVPLEVGPLFALDAAELAAKIDRRMTIDQPTYLH